MIITDNHFDEVTLKRIFIAEQEVKKFRKKSELFFCCFNAGNYWFVF